MKSLVVLGIAGLLSIAPTPRQRQFKSSTTVVRLEIGVTREGKPVEGLVAEDFAIDDDGRPPAIRAAARDDAALDVALVVPPLSAVAYISADQVSRFRGGVSAFLDQIQERDRLGVVIAGAPPRLARPLLPGRVGFSADGLSDFKDNYMASFDAIALGLTIFDTSERRRVLATFANAADFRSVLDGDGVVALTRRLDNAMLVFALPVSISEQVRVTAETTGGLSLGNPVEGSVLGQVLPVAVERFADDTHSHLLNLGGRQPATLMKDVVDSLRSYYIVTYDMPERRGWHQVKVKVNRRGVKVAVRQGYFVD